MTTVIIGAGIAGLTAAWRLHEAGIKVTLLEQSSNVGGCIRTMHNDGYLLELGPNTFLNSSVSLWNLAYSLGLKDLKIETPPKIGKTRFIFKKDKIVSVPAGPGILFSPLLSFKGRLRLLKEPFIKALSPGDESLASFVRRRLGEEVLHMLVTPFVSGIYAGDPEQLSVAAVFPKLVEVEKKYGSIFKGMKALKTEIKSSGLGSFMAGIGTLPMAIESRLKDSIVKNARVTGIEKLNSGYNIRFEAGGEQQNILAKKIICAVPAYTAARILSGLSNEFKEILSKIEYAPIIVIHTGYKHEDVPYDLKGFGFLVPRKNRVRILGSVWSSSLFQERAPEGYALLTNFLGGQLDPEAIDLTNDDIMRIVQKDLSRALSIKSPPAFACITRYTHAIPQYNIGHLEKISRISKLLEQFNGLFLTGSYFTGISVAETVEHAEKITKEVQHGFQSNI